MQDDKIKKELLEMATSSKGRPQSSRLNDLLPEIQHALNSGVSRKELLGKLHQHGFSLTMNTFNSWLSRARKKPIQSNLMQPREKPIPANTPPAETVQSTVDNPATERRHPPELEAQLVGLTPKQRREKIGEHYIKDRHGDLMKHFGRRDDESSGS